MYLEYYNLSVKPFDLSLKPGFLWLGEKHAEALATMKYGVQEDLGFLLLTGDVGAGKTVLIRRLVNNLDKKNTIVAHITDPGLAPADFFKMLAAEFNLPGGYQGKADFLIGFEQFLSKAYVDKKRVLLIIDEAQRLDNVLLDHIRVLSNIEKANKKLINIFFVGQPEFKNMLLKDSNRPLRQRIAVNYHIDPLTEPEVTEYISHRLKKAGRTQNLFTPDAVSEIFKFTQGYPRAINILCDHALLTGFSSGLNTIDSNVIKECKQELKIKAEKKKETAEHKQETVETKSETPNPRLSFASQPPIPLEKETRSSKFGGYSLIIGVCILLSALLLYLLLRPDSHETESQASNNPSEELTDRPPKPLANDEWRLEDKIEMEKSSASAASTSPPPVESQKMSSAETTDPPENEAGMNAAAETVTQQPELADPPAAAKLEEEVTAEGNEETEYANLKQAVEKETGDPVEKKETAVADTPNPVEDQKPDAAAIEPSDSSVDLAEPAPSVTVPDKSLQAMAVMSAAMAQKPSVEEKKAPPIKTIEKSTSTKNQETNTVAREKTIPKTTQTAAAPPKTIKPKTEPKARVTPIEKAKPNTALAAVVAAPEPKKKATAAVSTRPSAKTTAEKKPETVSAPKTVVEKKPETTVAASTAVAISPPKVAETPKTVSSSSTVSAVSPSTKAPTKQDDAALESRLRWFLKSYCVTYTRKDIEAFSKFFAPGAIENGKPFETLIPKYKRNFENIETIQYRIDLQRFSYDESKETVLVEGDFSLQWLPGDRKWRENSGTITMNLIDSGPSFLVQSLVYRGGGRKN